MLSLAFTTSTALIATPTMPTSAARATTASASSIVRMSMPQLSRRSALLAVGAAAAAPMPCWAATMKPKKSAVEVLDADRHELEIEQDIVRALDSALSSERKLAFDDETRINDYTDAYLKALQKGDVKNAAMLKAQLMEVEERYTEEEKVVRALGEKEDKNVALEKTLLAKVEADAEAVAAGEKREYIKQELAQTEAAISKESAAKLEQVFATVSASRE